MTPLLELFDADAHVYPAPTFWDDYLPRKFAGRGPKWEPGARRFYGLD